MSDYIRIYRVKCLQVAGIFTKNRDLVLKVRIVGTAKENLCLILSDHIRIYRVKCLQVAGIFTKDRD